MKKIAMIFFALLVQACAFTDAQLNVSHNADANFRGPMSVVEPLAFSQVPLVDNRRDKARIGWKKNGYGQQTADITTVLPNEVILGNAIQAGLSQNGHSLGDDGRVAISGTFNTFWFEADMNFWTVEFIGNVQCDLVFLDTRTNAVIYESSYSGNYSEKKGGGLNKTWEKVMNKAVDRLVEDIVFDEDLVEALEKLPR